MVIANFHFESSTGVPVQFSQSADLPAKMAESVNQLRMTQRGIYEPASAPQFAYVASAMWGGCTPEAQDLQRLN